MKRKKRALTLVELMATLAILSIALTMIGGLFLQGYKIANRTSNYAAIEDEFRNAIIRIENNINKASKPINENDEPVKVYESGTSYEFEEKTGEKLIEIRKDSEIIVYAEMDIDKENNKSQLWEVVSNTKASKDENKPTINILINEIDKNKDKEGILVAKNEDGIINLSMAGITKGKEWRANAYSGTIKTNNNQEITVNVGTSGSGNPEPPVTIPPTDIIPPSIDDDLIDLLLGGPSTFVVLGESNRNLISVESSSDNYKHIDKEAFYIQPMTTEELNTIITDKKGDSLGFENMYSGQKEIKFPSFKGLESRSFTLTDRELNSYKEIENGNSGIAIKNINGKIKVVVVNGNLTLTDVNHLDDFIILANGKITLQGTGTPQFNIKNKIKFVSKNGLNINNLSGNVKTAPFNMSFSEQDKKLISEFLNKCMGKQEW